MKIIFTICSNNYLAQAKALGDSILLTNPEYTFYIGLVDNLSSEIDYEHEIDYSIILCDEIGIPDFDSLWKKYDIIELNTCVKPFYLKYFTEKHKDLTHLMYFDPDTFVFGNLTEIENELSHDKEIILTPHILNPIPLDNYAPGENTFLNFGIYNLGFIGIKNPSNNHSFFSWWSDRTYHRGYSNVSDGFFVDQLWMNLTPIFFDKTIISKHYGLNVAPWNLHERKISQPFPQNWLINDITSLIFYHFSSYNYTDPTKISKYYSRYSFENRPDLITLYEYYHMKILENNIEKLSKIECDYVLKRNKFISENTPIVKKNKVSFIKKLKNKLSSYINK